MARPSKATPEAVDDAITAIIERGEKPTVGAVRDEIGGGSYSTLSGLAQQALKQREGKAVLIEEMPETVTQAAQNAAAEIYRAARSEAMTEVEAARADAKRRIGDANAQADDAAKEIGRLESEAEERIKEIDDLRRSLEKARHAAAKAEAVTAELRDGMTKAEKRADRSDQAKDAAESKAAKMAEEAAELRGQLSALKRQFEGGKGRKS